MDTTDPTTLYNMGCAEANRVEGGTSPKNGQIIFDFGDPRKFSSTSWGATCYSGPDCTLSNIREGAQQYARGYFKCLTASNGSDPAVFLRVALGTNSHFPSGFDSSLVYEHGKQVG